MAHGKKPLALAGALAGAVLLFVWAGLEYVPDGATRGAYNAYYDVSDLVQAPAGGIARFGNTTELVAYLRLQLAGHGAHYGPHLIADLGGGTRILAWGSWPEQLRLRKALDAVRDT